MRYPIGPMSLGDILGRSFRLFFSRFFLLSGIMLAVESPLLLFQLLLPDLMVNGPGPILLMLPRIILQAVGTGAVIRVVMQEYLDRPVGFGEALRFASHSLALLLGTSLLSGMFVCLGSLACLIPGIYLGIVFSLASQIVIVEGRAGMDALNRSMQLVQGHFVRAFGILFLLVLFLAVPAGVVSGLAQAALPYQQIDRFRTAHLTSYPNYAVNVVLTALVEVIFQGFAAVCTTLLYFDLRNRKEAFDLELEADKLSAWAEHFHPRPQSASTDIQAPDVAVQPPGPAAPPGETGIRPGEPEPPKRSEPEA